MPKNRKGAEDHIIKYIDKIAPGGQNADLYRKMFASMSDKQFDTFMADLESKTKRLAVIVPNLTKIKINTDRNIQIGKELGHDFFEQIWINRGDGTPEYLTPVKYMVVHLPLRRQAQLLEKKRSIPENNNSVDDLTGQPTGASKGSKLSFPEIQVLAARGLDANIKEMIKARGGDTAVFNEMNTVISRTGSVSLSAIDKGNTQVKAVKTFNTLLKCMHFESSL